MSLCFRSIYEHHFTIISVYVTSTWNPPIRNFICLRFPLLESFQLASIHNGHRIVNMNHHHKNLSTSYTTYSASLRPDRTNISFVTFLIYGVEQLHHGIDLGGFSRQKVLWSHLSAGQYPWEALVILLAFAFLYIRLYWTTTEACSPKLRFCILTWREGWCRAPGKDIWDGLAARERGLGWGSG